jgi:hypothetical protein
MKSLLLKDSRRWSLYTILITAMTYLALTFTGGPAYAATCTPSHCSQLNLLCTETCQTKGGIMIFSCPATPTTFFCLCKEGGGINGSC